MRALPVTPCCVQSPATAACSARSGRCRVRPYRRGAPTAVRRLLCSHQRHPAPFPERHATSHLPHGQRNASRQTVDTLCVGVVAVVGRGRAGAGTVFPSADTGCPDTGCPDTGCAETGCSGHVREALERCPQEYSTLPSVAAHALRGRTGALARRIVPGVQCWRAQRRSCAVARGV